MKSTMIYLKKINLLIGVDLGSTGESKKIIRTLEKACGIRWYHLGYWFNKWFKWPPTTKYSSARIVLNRMFEGNQYTNNWEVIDPCEIEWNQNS